MIVGRVERRSRYRLVSVGPMRREPVAAVVLDYRLPDRSGLEVLIEIRSARPWLPVVMNSAGHSTSQAVLAGTSLWVGGIVGNWLLGWVVDRSVGGPLAQPRLRQEFVW